MLDILPGGNRTGVPLVDAPGIHPYGRSMSPRGTSGTAQPPWAMGAPDEGDSQTAAAYIDLARARRKQDFRWFARSQGMASGMIEQLWRELRALRTPASSASVWRQTSRRAAARRGSAGPTPSARRVRLSKAARQERSRRTGSRTRA